MCLVSYIPLESGFVLSSNRDESPMRDAPEIIQQSINGQNVYYPGDEAGGSWIFCSDNNRVVCILNGAFVNHERKLPYRKSRGLVGKEFFEYSNASEFLEKYDLVNIEPFTMIIVEDSLPFELRWDGGMKYVEEFNAKEIHTWSSCTLYNDRAIEARAFALRENLRKIDLNDSLALEKAHLLRDKENLFNGLYMERDDIVKTISHTQIVHRKGRTTLAYRNLIRSSSESVKIK